MNETDASKNDPPRYIRAILFDYHTLHHHPLARSIEYDELIPLAVKLQARFAQAGVQLGVSPESLPLVRTAAAAYANQAARSRQRFTDEDHLRITRELAAYLGLVFLRFSEGTWLAGTCLLEAAAGQETEFELIRGTEKKTVTRMTVSVGYLAADMWDLALSGSHEPLDLYFTAYVVSPDGHAEWEKPRVRVVFGDDENSFPSAWRVRP